MTWSETDVRNLGVITDLTTAGSIFGFGRTKSYELAASDRFPVPVLRLGAQYRVPVAPIIEALFLTPHNDDAGPDQDPATVTHLEPLGKARTNDGTTPAA